MSTTPEHPLYFVKGCSMFPVLRTGDRVTLRKIHRKEIRAGDIIVFTTGAGKQIIHRVIRLKPLQTRGEHCVNDDLPVPETSPVFKAVSCRRDEIVLLDGDAGICEFRKHQRILLTSNSLKKRLTPFLLRNPFKIPENRHE